MSYENLLIKAEDFADCDIISSLLQDSIFHVSFHSFHKEKKCLRLLLNRFCWEAADPFNEDQCYYRVHSGLYIGHVESVAANDDLKKDRYLNLLALHSSNGEINLVFSENKSILIGVSNILIYLKDLHDKYPTMSIPEHDCQDQNQ
jgi:hypothetical protein